jgi:glycosyltransferase involved in cell wall biosynthesis
MRSLVFLVPGRLATLTGGSIYDRRMVDGLRGRGWSVDVRELDEGFPRPSTQALDHAARTLASLADGSTVIVDGLALGAIPEVLRPHAERLKLVALVHLPLAAEVGLDASVARELEASERRALQSARAVVVTGCATVDAVKSLGVRPEAVAVVEPGTDPAPISERAPGEPLNLLCVAGMTAGKGHEDLIRALAANRDLGWTLTCVGSLTRHPITVERVRRLVAAEGLGDRVALTGEREPGLLERYYGRADLFVLNTMRETYGMAVAEALAHGLPVVSTRTGEIPTLAGGPAGDLNAGLIVEPGDLPALTNALRRVLSDAGLLERLRDGAKHARRRLEGWEVAAARMAAVLERVSADG